MKSTPAKYGMAAVALIAVVVAFQNCAPQKFTEVTSITQMSEAVIPPPAPNSFSPNSFGFQDQSNIALNTPVTSDSVILTGTGTDEVAAICVNCFVQKNGSGVFAETLSGVKSGDSVIIKAVSSNSYSGSIQAYLKVGAMTSRPWTITASAGNSNQCASSQGRACQKIIGEEVRPNCPANYGCSDFTGIYYGSANGCDTSTAESWVEYSFDGTTMWSRSYNNTTKTPAGDNSSTFHCTYIGFAPNDSFNGIPNGSCVKANSYGSDNTYTRVIPGTNCAHKVQLTAPGTVQCDGTCE